MKQAETFTSLPNLQTAAWACLARGLEDHNAPARHPTLATLGRDGAPRTRTVVLRACDPVTASFEVHTDASSAKAKELCADPRACLHVWDPQMQLQIRIQAEVQMLAGVDAATQWARVPDLSRLAYGATPPPGSQIPTPEGFEPGADPERFMRLLGQVRSMDVLHLGRIRHVRARFDRQDDFTGVWLVP